jgi:hypothetical protein
MAKKTDKAHFPPTAKDVEEFELLLPLLEAMLAEVRALSQKKQDGALNPLKIKMINKILVRIKDVLRNEPTSAFVELLDEVTLPTNSDVK